MAKKPVLPLARLTEAKVLKGKGKTKGNGPFPLWAKAQAKAKAMAKQKAKARDYSLASPSSHVKKELAKQKPKAPARRSKANKAVVYLRTSSAANVGDETDCESRQRARCQEHADNCSYTIMQEYRDPAVSGADPLISRPESQAW